jgi:hypothetical protein
MQTWRIDTTILAVDQRSWCAAGLLGREDEEAISSKHLWKISGIAANTARPDDSDRAVSDKNERSRAYGQFFINIRVQANAKRLGLLIAWPLGQLSKIT